MAASINALGKQGLKDLQWDLARREDCVSVSENLSQTQDKIHNIH